MPDDERGARDDAPGARPTPDADRRLGAGGFPTLEEVAAEAGVSRATVSRVINDSPRVSPAARSLVQDAITKLGYVPNRAARSLVTRRTDSVALVVSEPESRIFADPFFGRIVRTVSSVLAETNLQLVLLFTSADEQHDRLGQYAKGHVDGVLLISVHADDPLPRLLMEAGVPTVLLGRPADAPGLTYVDADNRGGAREAVRHLAGTGRRRIATITGPSDMAAGQDRLDGYRDGLAEVGLPFDEALVAPGEFIEEGGAEAMRALLDRAPDVDAVFCASDLMAAGALRTLHAAGKRVPDDIAVIGFDDSVTARHTNPPLTTVRQPVDEMGRRMTELLLAKLAGQGGDDSVILDTELVRRSSA